MNCKYKDQQYFFLSLRGTGSPFLACCHNSLLTKMLVHKKLIWSKERGNLSGRVTEIRSEDKGRRYQAFCFITTWKTGEFYAFLAPCLLFEKIWENVEKISSQRSPQCFNWLSMRKCECLLRPIGMVKFQLFSNFSSL